MVHNCIHSILQLSHTCKVYMQLLERAGLELSVQACNAKSMYVTSVKSSVYYMTRIYCYNVY